MDQKDQPRSSTVNAVTAKRFSQMTAGEKIKHIGKTIVFLLTFGFVFPTILSD